MSRSLPEDAGVQGGKSNAPAIIALILVITAIGLVGWYAFAPSANPTRALSSPAPVTSQKEAEPASSPSPDTKRLQQTNL